VRYWFDQADEDSDRELERRRHLGLCVLQSDSFPKWVIGFLVLVFLPEFLAMDGSCRVRLILLCRRGPAAREIS